MLADVAESHWMQDVEGQVKIPLDSQTHLFGVVFMP